MTALADTLSAGEGFSMPCAAGVVRIRPSRRRDPYNPAREVEDGGAGDELELRGFIASSSSTVSTDGAREQTSSSSTLTVVGSADIRPGDIVRAEPDDGRRWRVTGFASKDANPFTGWQPTTEANLEEVLG